MKKPMGVDIPLTEIKSRLRVSIVAGAKKRAYEDVVLEINRGCVKDLDQLKQLLEAKIATMRGAAK